jgi:hypothetical protein
MRLYALVKIYLTTIIARGYHNRENIVIILLRVMLSAEHRTSTTADGGILYMLGITPFPYHICATTLSIGYYIIDAGCLHVII